VPGSPMTPYIVLPFLWQPKLDGFSFPHFAGQVNRLYSKEVYRHWPARGHDLYISGEFVVAYRTTCNKLYEHQSSY